MKGSGSMDSDEVLGLAWFLSAATICVHYLGVDVSDPLFVVAGLVFVVSTALVIFHVCINAGRGRKERLSVTGRSEEKVQPQAPAGYQRADDQTTRDRQAMEAVLRDKP